MVNQMSEPPMKVKMKAFVTVHDGGTNSGAAVFRWENGEEDSEPFVIVGPVLNIAANFSNSERLAVTLTWDPPEVGRDQLEEYLVFQWSNKDNNWVDIDAVPVEDTGLSYEATDLTPGTKYRWAIISSRKEPVGGCLSLNAPDNETQYVDFGSEAYTNTICIPGKIPHF